MVRRMIFTTAVAAAALGTTGCADDGTSLQIECPVVPERSNDSCTWSATSTTCVGDSGLNLAVASSYSLRLKVTNGLVERESEIPLRPETNNMDVETAEVTIAASDGATLDFGNLDNPYTVNATGRIPVGGAGIATIQAIPPSYVDMMEASGFEAEENIVLFVKLNARTDGDVPVSSRDWRWPLPLINVPAGPRACNASDDDEVQCYVGQDSDLFPPCSALP